MKIVRAEWLPFRVPYAAAFATAHGAPTAREGLLLRLTAGDGLVGLGEASPVPGFGGGALPDALRILGSLAGQLVGRSLDEADGLAHRLPLAGPGAVAAACALDTALLDLRARAAGMPVASLLLVAQHSALVTQHAPVEVNATIGTPGTEEAGAAAGAAVSAGFRCVKLKVGICGGVEAELARIEAVRDVIGPGVRLRIDANGAWGAEEAIAALRGAERFGIELAEQPVPAGDLVGMARVRRAVAIPIAADEAVGTPEQALRVVAAGAADVLVVKPMLAGGLRPALDVISIARAAGLRAIVTTTIDSGVGDAAALHLAATLPEPRLACGLATGTLLAASLVLDPPSASGGAMQIPRQPGLGVALDDLQLARYGLGWRERGS